MIARGKGAERLPPRVKATLHPAFPFLKSGFAPEDFGAKPDFKKGKAIIMPSSLEAHSHISPLFRRRQLDEYANVRHRFAVISLDQFLGKHRQPQDKVRPDSNPEKHFVQFLPRPADVLAVRSREKVNEKRDQRQRAGD